MISFEQVVESTQSFFAPDNLMRIWETTLSPVVLGIVLIIVTYFVARMIRTGVSKLLHKSGIDKRLTALLKSDTHINITDPLVTMSYYAVWLFALPMILEAFRFTQPLMQPIQDVINNIFNFVPLLISAGVVFAVFFFAANALRLIITQVLDGIGLTKMMGKMGLQSMVDRVNPTKLAGNIVFIMLVLLGATQAIDILKLPVLSSIVQTVLTISGNVLFGSAIIAL